MGLKIGLGVWVVFKEHDIPEWDKDSLSHSYVEGRVISFDAETVAVWSDDNQMLFAPIGDVFPDLNAAIDELHRRG